MTAFSHTDSNPALLELLVRVAIAANEAETLESASQIAVDAVCDATGWPVGHLYTIDDVSPDLMRPTTVWHLADPIRYRTFRMITEATSLERGKGLPGRVLALGRPVWIVDVTKDDNFPRATFAVDIGIKAAFALPIVTGSNVLGALEFFAEDPREPDDRLLHILAQVGTQLGRVAERASAEQALRASETRFRAAAQSAVDAIVAADGHGDITFWNRGAERVFGYKSTEILGRPLSVLMPERFREAHRRGLARANAGGQASLIGRTVELAGLTKDGREFPLELSLSTWSSGRDRFFTGIIRDITERKRVEGALRQSGETLRQAAKMESIGRLAGGIAHDFNNLLTLILGYTDLLVENGRSAPEADRWVDEIRQSANRASALTQRLLAFSRKQVLQPVVVDLRDVLRGMEDMLRRLIGEDVQLELVLPRESCSVSVDPNQLEQVVMNLAGNARDAMPRGGALTIAVERREMSGSDSASHPDARPGPYALIIVSDTGCGMDAATKARIFEPFFTTKSVEKGTGLGMAMAYGFIQQSGGFIQVESEPDQGATFLICLPRVEGHASAAHDIKRTASFKSA